MLAITLASFIDDGYDFGVMFKTLTQRAGRPSKLSLQRSPKCFIQILDRDFRTRIQSYLWVGKKSLKYCPGLVDHYSCDLADHEFMLLMLHYWTRVVEFELMNKNRIDTL